MLLLLAATHCLVDATALIVAPLWPSLDSRMHLPRGGVYWLYALWSASTSFGQFAIACVADRFPCRWMIWVGPAVAVACLSCLGWADSPWTLAGLLCLGGLGVAAFHPEAAATAGNCLGERRSRAMAVFALGGYLGQSIGPLYSGWISEHYGLQSLVWGMVPGFGWLIILSLLLRTPNRPAVAPNTPKRDSTSQLLSKNIGPVSLLMLIGTLRVVAASGVSFSLVFLLDPSGANPTLASVQITALLCGIGAGGASTIFLKPRHERSILWSLPICAAPFLVTIPLVSGYWMTLVVGLSGYCLGISLPLLISYGQRLIPEGQRVASSLTMGVTWGVGGLLIPVMTSVLAHFQAEIKAFWVYGICALLSGLLCHGLPKLGDPAVVRR